MIKVFTSKQSHPVFKMSETSYHTFPGFPQHIVKEKTWNYRNGTVLHRFYVSDKNYNHSEYICDIISDERGIFPRAQEESISICNRNGCEYYKHMIKKEDNK